MMTRLGAMNKIFHNDFIGGIQDTPEMLNESKLMFVLFWFILIFFFPIFSIFAVIKDRDIYLSVYQFIGNIFSGKEYDSNEDAAIRVLMFNAIWLSFWSVIGLVIWMAIWLV